MADKTIRIKIEGATARADANRVNQSVQNIGRSADSASNSLGTLSRVASAVTAALATSQVVRYADAWTNVNNRIKAATKTSLEFTTAQNAVIQIAQEAGVEITGVADAYSRISQATSELGITQERVLDVTRKVTLALKAGGATGAETSAVMVQLGQALGSGALQGDELRSILEASIPISKALAKEFNVTVGELKKLGSEGKLTSDRVVEAIEKMDESALTFTKDITAGITAVNNALTVYVGRMDEALGASENINGVLSGLANNLDAVVSVVGDLLQLTLAFYLTNITKAVVANTAAFAANQIQIIRYQTTLATMAGVSRTAAASTWALTYAMRALKAALPFGVVLLGLEVLQRLLTSTNDQIEANDRYAESTRKLNERLETRAEREKAIALRSSAELNARNQDKLLKQQEKIEKERLKLERSNAADLAKIRGEEYDAADKLSLFQITKTQNRIKVMEEEARRLQRIADKSQAAFEKIQGSIGGQTSKGKITEGAFVDPSQAVGASETRQTNRDLDSFFGQDGIFSGSRDNAQAGNNLTEKLERENQMIQQSLMNRQLIYQNFFAAANDLEATEYERQTAQLAFNLASQIQQENQAFQTRLQNITDRQLSIADNKSLNEQQKQEAQRLLDEQAVLARQEFENRVTEIAEEGAARRAQIEQQEAVNKINTYQGYANTALQLANAFGSKSEKENKKRRKTAVVIDTAAGISRAFAENNFYTALGISALIAANGLAQISAINSAGSSSSVSSPSGGATSIPTQATPTASTQQQSQRIIDIRGLDDNGTVTLNKSELVSLLSSDEDVILSVNNGQKQGQRVGLTNG